jgi:hypothetical protein
VIYSTLYTPKGNVFILSFHCEVEVDVFDVREEGVEEEVSCDVDADASATVGSVIIVVVVVVVVPQQDNCRRGELNAERGEGVKFKLLFGKVEEVVETTFEGGVEEESVILVAAVKPDECGEGRRCDVLSERVGVGRGLCTRRIRFASFDVIKRGSDLDGVRKGGTEDFPLLL